jgi:hypothetical protein
VEFRKTTDETRFEMLAHGDIDVIIDLTPRSEEKLRQADFSDEIFRSGSGLLVKKAAPSRAWTACAREYGALRHREPRRGAVEGESARGGLMSAFPTARRPSPR